MTKLSSKIAAYDDEVLFQVGQRVIVDMPEVPKEARADTHGVIRQIRTKFPASPKLRRITYTVDLDGKGNYFKKSHRFLGGLTTPAVTADKLRLEDG